MDILPDCESVAVETYIRGDSANLGSPLPHHGCRIHDLNLQSVGAVEPELRGVRRTMQPKNFKVELSRAHPPAVRARVQIEPASPVAKLMPWNWRSAAPEPEGVDFINSYCSIRRSHSQVEKWAVALRRGFGIDGPVRYPQREGLFFIVTILVAPQLKRRVMFSPGLAGPGCIRRLVYTESTDRDRRTHLF